MPDFSASRSGLLPTKRPTSHSRDDAAAAGSSSSNSQFVAPSPTPRRSLQFLALAACIGFLLLQLLPATHVRHPADPTRTWIPLDPKGSRISASRFDSLQKHDVPSSNVSAHDMLGVASSSEGANEEHATATQFLKGIKEPTVHVFVSTNEMDLRPLLVLINSTIVNARNRGHLHFHLIVPDVVQANWLYKLKHYFDVKIEMVGDVIAIQALQNYTVPQKATRIEEPYSMYNFVLPQIPLVYKDIERFIYLDSDVVVQDDVEELIHIDMEGKAVSAVEDCFLNYSQFPSLTSLDALKAEEKQVPWLADELLEPRTCLINTGVLVINIKSWNANNLTQAFEWWITKLQKGGKADGRLEHLEASLQLVLHYSYKKLDAAWNVHGLAHIELTELERDYLEKLYSKRPDKRPFLSPKADHAKLLQFSGKYKPWLRESTRDHSQPAISLCGIKAKECASFWWKHISPDAIEFLRPLTNQVHN
ncbi:hypothetical protein O6H91_07G089800 [Diphasiastrum complanatum]|uniref:Uncharacterized protein n=1 Tax=Diphasiastrum complanatum TaxID=34168 RepID=A0ACC2D7Y6_DIPCM|nr:hypothetical protein O6H91_07G089800 [Diphasiastrum complanatum]